MLVECLNGWMDGCDMGRWNIRITELIVKKYTLPGSALETVASHLRGDECVILISPPLGGASLVAQW